MSNIIYGTTFTPIINWENVTQFQFKMDWIDLLADKADMADWNRDRLIIAILNIIEDEKLTTLMNILANRRDTLIDMNMIRKALQIEATTRFYEDGKFNLENQAYLEYLDNMVASTVEGGNVLFHFYHIHKEKFSEDEHVLFRDYVTTIQNEKLKADILGFIQLNNYVPATVEIEDPDSEILAQMEEQLKIAEIEEAVLKAALEEKPEKNELEKANAQPSEQDMTPTTRVNLRPSVVEASVPSRLSIDTSNSGDESLSPRSLPVPIRITTPIIASTAPVVLKKVSLATRIANKWKALPTRYKLAAFGFAMLGIAATVLGIVFPPSLTVTIPLLKVSSSTLLTVGGAALTAVTLVGHAIHISRQPAAKTVVLPVSETAPDVIQPQPAAEVEEQEVTVSSIHSPQTGQNGLEEKYEHADYSSSAPLSNVSLDHCGSTQTERQRSRSASSVTILSILQAPHNTPTSASALAHPVVLPTASSSVGYDVPTLLRSRSMRTSKEEDSTKANRNGERVANISPRV